MSDLFVRVPYISNTVCAELEAHYALNGEIFLAPFYSPRPRCMRHRHGDRLPIMQSSALRFCDWEAQIRHLALITAPDLYEDVHRFACHVCMLHYNMARAVELAPLGPQEEASVAAISNMRCGNASDDFYWAVDRACRVGPAQSGA